MARGRLRSFATVYVHPEIEQPFTVVEVVLDAGPLVRAVGDAPVDGRSGGRVIATRLGLGDRPYFEGEGS
ncbi:hypothetical protein AB0F17_56690 [Nonomuraea sp. NPDC026600]|uniref:hypothetical protein n=1 Tax=Nonomuraea sp. NPDC026600 TaxID=3155363 RepID=UPI00340E9E14